MQSRKGQQPAFHYRKLPKVKISILGAAGVRTPLIIQAIQARQDRLGLTELCLMDIDADHLELIGALISPITDSTDTKFVITGTTDPIQALTNANFVITTFRVGNIESRVIDERVPLDHGILGQETTGAGGFAMGLRSIPVLLDYVKLMQHVCPDAWMINFANPAGMLTEAVVRHTDWHRIIGICDGPASMHQFIAAILQAKPKDVYLDYFGLNHLGWVKSVIYQNKDHLPDLMQSARSLGNIPELPFDIAFLISLGLIPNEYLYYYYYRTQAVNNILEAGECRGEMIARLNPKLFTDLSEKLTNGDFEGMQTAYHAYLDRRHKTYMVNETGKNHDYFKHDTALFESVANEGYAGVALNLIEGLLGNAKTVQILNVHNQGAVPGMEDNDVVEIPALVSHNHVQPLAVNNIPVHCMGLMLQVKQYEHLTIEAALENSYQKALLALATHPLVSDYTLAKSILDDYILRHKDYFPVLE